MHIEHLKLATDGSIQLSPSLRESIGLSPGDEVLIESDGDSLLISRLTTCRSASVREVAERT